MNEQPSRKLVHPEPPSGLPNVAAPVPPSTPPHIVRSEEPPRYDVITSTPREFMIEAQEGAARHTFRARRDSPGDCFTVWLNGRYVPVVVDGQGVRDIVSGGIPEVVAVWMLGQSNALDYDTDYPTRLKTAADEGLRDWLTRLGNPAKAPGIEPALSAEEWHDVRAYEASNSPVNRGEKYDEIISTAAGMITAYNDLLPDDDPRKITREKLNGLRDCVEWDSRVGGPADAAIQFLDALESYLPPQ